jgi:hypothetical protein
VSDGEGHCEHGEAKGQSDADETNSQDRIASGKHGRTAAAEDQPEGAEKLCEGAFEQGQDVPPTYKNVGWEFFDTLAPALTYMTFM